jgi:uncharacterized glyoxalase superfamily protein PhnB
MPELAKQTRATIVPALQYRDAPAAVDWLCRAFGFTRRMVVPGENGTIAHAELVFGNGMIMLGSRKSNEFGRLLTEPRQAGAVTQAVYLIVEDADAHYARAKAAGAEIVTELKTQDYGGRDYTCRDPEGHVWAFGTYDPWAQQAQPG